MKTKKPPIGFEKALARNQEAMNKFSELSESQKKEIMNSTNNIRSKDDMQRLYNRIAADY